MGTRRDAVLPVKYFAWDDAKKRGAPVNRGYTCLARRLWHEGCWRLRSASAWKGRRAQLFTGRELELAMLLDAVETGSRHTLAYVYGPGGIGKSELPIRCTRLSAWSGDAKYLDLRETPPRTIYLNAFQEPRMLANRFALKTTGRPEAVAGEVQRIVREELKAGTLSEMTTMDELVDASIVPERVMAMLSGFFGALGAALAALGLYGLLAYTVTRRTSEIGIRMALGAAKSEISRMVLRGALGLAGVGLVIGLPLALLSRSAASRVVTDLPADSMWSLVVAATTMLAMALVAAYVPARRAARVEVVDALRL